MHDTGTKNLLPIHILPERVISQKSKWEHVRG